MVKFTSRLTLITGSALVLAAASTAVAVGATGGSSAARPAAHRAPARAATAVDPSGRPQLRLTMSEAETQQHWDRYNGCLIGHGVPTYPGRGASPVQEHRDPAAERACAGLLPRMPKALDSDRNPRFAADLAQQIACMNARGVPVQADPDGGFWTYREPRSARERACELQAFAADDR
jgi:hypothetical protein